MRLRLALAAATVVTGTLVGAGVAPANDIASFTTVYGTDVVHAGFGGMRDDGSGTITVAGVSGTVTKAYLYWQGPTRSTDASANASVTFAGTAVTGTNIGLSSDNCWGYANSHAYRADVTSLVSGNGPYALAGFVKSSGDINVNGVSLLVFFDDGNAANNRDVVLFDGNDSNISNIYDADGWNVSLAGINYTAGSAAITLHVSDGQSFADDDLVLNSSTLVGAGPIFQGDSVPGGLFDAGGNLWDIESYDITSFLSPGPNTLTLTTGVNSDCLSLVVAAIDLPAGAAPPPPAKATTTTYTGAASVQYSDAANLSARLTETSGGAPVPGKTIDFTLGTQTASAGPTDGSGDAATSLVVSQKPGTVASVGSAFAGDASFLTSSDTDAFAILREDCTLTYSGDTLVAPLAMTKLAADMGEPDASLGDRAGKTVTFTAVDAASNSSTHTAVTNASGHAETDVALPPGVYDVTVSFAGDDWYNACATATGTLVTVQQAGAKVTGGGWVSIGTGRTNFGFNAIPIAGGGWKGQIQVRPQSNKDRFHGNVVTSLTGSGNSATWSGSGFWNGQPGYTYTVSVVDNGSSGKKGDTISILIKNASNATVYSTGGAQALKGGNITVH